MDCIVYVDNFQPIQHTE